MSQIMRPEHQINHVFIAADEMRGQLIRVVEAYQGGDRFLSWAGFDWRRPLPQSFTLQILTMRGEASFIRRRLIADHHPRA